MVALRGKDIDAFLARPDPARPIVLLYGPDAGLVRERADALLASAVDDPHDPFSLVKLDGDELAAEPFACAPARAVLRVASTPWRICP
jgi:DNA polymerase-3 subunit delta